MKSNLLISTGAPGLLRHHIAHAQIMICLKKASPYQAGFQGPSND